MTKTILFFGDSVTDAGRERDNPHSLGHGYVHHVGQTLTNVRIINKGISGNRSYDLLDRLDEDVIGLSPDILFVMIGINDVWHKHQWNVPSSTEEFALNMNTLITTIQDALPGVKIVILSPFLLPTGVHTEPIRRDLDTEIAILESLSKTHDIPFIPVDVILRGFLETMSAEDIAADGVHPTEKGHRLIAQEIIRFIDTSDLLERNHT
jgi:acyl-CoA thioesterase I